KQGKTLLLTTHYMDEAQRLCDHIVIIDGGKVLDEGTPKVLIKQHVEPHVFEFEKPIAKKVTALLCHQEDLGESVAIYTDDAEAVLKNIPADTVYYHRPANLEDVFLRLTGRSLREK